MTFNNCDMLLVSLLLLFICKWIYRIQIWYLCNIHWRHMMQVQHIDVWHCKYSLLVQALWCPLVHLFTSPEVKVQRRCKKTLNAVNFNNSSCLFTRYFIFRSIWIQLNQHHYPVWRVAGCSMLLICWMLYYFLWKIAMSLLLWRWW